MSQIVPRLQLIGTGEAVDPNLSNTSLLYRGSQNVLFDCGYSVPQALWRVTTDPELLDAVVISHRHADHAFGLPGLLLWLREAGRSRPLTLCGGPGLESWLERLTDLAYSGFLGRSENLVLVRRPIIPAETARLGALELRCAWSAHGEPNLAIRIDDGDVSFCYSGDGSPTPETIRLYQDANLLVHECYAATPGTKGHAHLGQVLDLARQARVGKLALVHLGVNERQVIADALASRGGEVVTVIPRPGETLALGRSSG